MKPSLHALLIDKVARALEAGAAFVVPGRTGAAASSETSAATPVRAPRVAVALSGGRDSVALLHAARAALETAIEAGDEPGGLTSAAAPLLAFHIHHGLQPEADSWDAFCAQLCGDWRIPYRSVRVQAKAERSEGIEAAARRARYVALDRLCREEGVRFLLFAHHGDDQVETVLLRLFRGSGVHGLAGMPAMRPLAPDSDTMLLRPWLDVPRAQLEQYCAIHQLRWIDDPSNDDARYARNALRRHLPALIEHFPALQANVRQAASHLSEAAQALDAIALRQLHAIRFRGRDADTLSELDLAALRALPAAQADTLLRLWLRQLGARAPTTARLAAMRAQLVASDGGEPAVPHDGLVLRRFQGRLLACRALAAPPQDVVSLHWQGQGVLAVPQWNGALHFEQVAHGGVPEPLLRGALTLGPRKGGERIVLRPGGPARPLKHAYQEAGVPAWRRPFLPVLRAQGQLVLAAGLGMHQRWPEGTGGPRWRVDWVSEPGTGDR